MKAVAFVVNSFTASVFLFMVGGQCLIRIFGKDLPGDGGILCWEVLID